MTAVRQIEGKMAKNVKPSSSATDIGSKPANGPSWRVDRKSFVELSCSRVFQTGVENYSAGWLAQAHEVCEPAMQDLKCPIFNFV
jgi:hypothetical protein